MQGEKKRSLRMSHGTQRVAIGCVGIAVLSIHKCVRLDKFAVGSLTYLGHSRRRSSYFPQLQGSSLPLSVDEEGECRTTGGQD